MAKILYTDLMEYSSDALAQVAFVSSDGKQDPASWDLLDEDCADISDWVDQDAVNGISEVSPASQFRMDCNVAGNGCRARRQRTPSTADIMTVEIKLYHDALGTRANNDHFRFILAREKGATDGIFDAHFGTEGLFIYNGSTWQEIGTDLVNITEWQTWRFVIDFTTLATQTISVYLNDIFQESLSSSYAMAGWGDYMAISQYGYTTNDMLTHIDYIKIVTGEYGVNLQSYSESTIKQQGSYSLKAIAAQTDSLNDTLTKTLTDYLDYSIMDKIIFQIRASRTGTNIQLQIHDTGVVSGWSVLNEDCADISDWVDQDAINGISSQVAFDSKSSFKLYTGNAATGSYAERKKTFSIPNNYTLEFNLYADAIDDSDCLKMDIYNGVIGLFFKIRSDGLFVYDGSTYNEVGTDLVVQDQWQKWRFEVKGGNAATATCDVYLNDVLKASNVDCSNANATADNCTITLFGYLTASRIVYFDDIKIANDTGINRHNVNIASADTWQTESWDISAIATANRDTIDKIIIKIINVDAINTFYIDNMYSQAIIEHSYPFLGG